MNIIELIIPRSSSTSLPGALAIARKFNHFAIPEDNREPYCLKVETEELRAQQRTFETLYEMVRGWKGTQLLIGGQLADRQDFRTLVEIFQCAERCTAAVTQNEYCGEYNGHRWGCRHLRRIQCGLPSSSYDMMRSHRYWFQFGHFNNDCSMWTVDKAELFEAINKEATSTYVELCPFFNIEIVQHHVDALPLEIVLTEDSSWEIMSEEQCSGSIIQQVPIGIKPKQLSLNEEFGVLKFSLHEEESPNETRNRNIPEVSFDDIGGVDEIIGLVREVIELPLKHPNLFSHLGITPHKGILLYGPPGCGKTLIAKAIANDIDAHFISISGPELFSKWFGKSEENLRDIFIEARNCAPSIIFFDEFDAIAQKRSADENARYESVFVNQLLTLMDGMETYENVCVIASTNRSELLDEAIMRPGRFDYTLEIKHPSPLGVRKILQIHTRKMPLAKSVNLDKLASCMNGLTGADIAFIARESAYNCLRRSCDPYVLLTQKESEVDIDSFKVEQVDFEVALVKIINSHAELTCRKNE